MSHVISSVITVRRKAGKGTLFIFFLLSFIFHLSSSSHTETAIRSLTAHTAHSSSQQLTEAHRIPSEGKPLFAFISVLFSLRAKFTSDSVDEILKII